MLGVLDATTYLLNIASEHAKAYGGWLGPVGIKWLEVFAVFFSSMALLAVAGYNAARAILVMEVHATVIVDAPLVFGFSCVSLLLIFWQLLEIIFRKRGGPLGVCCYRTPPAAASALVPPPAGTPSSKPPPSNEVGEAAGAELGGELNLLSAFSHVVVDLLYALALLVESIIMMATAQSDGGAHLDAAAVLIISGPVVALGLFVLWQLWKRIAADDLLVGGEQREVA